ncbi:ABC transporter ATP-binding protein [Nocardia puris]|uniref:ABC-2 type transport system ATP-binding protein n=1 Tax=Nocardia puris TaxID=208602 RepID=A0A366E331_9NOCA|nr:ABC transporter ATP-binding protein [Nocardia puris]MBF6214398.1 ABC transporter ATP-binding protein [Nocardia puris]MBF6369013.1 ABC transporter ATP-binding protein [Nocardia puris]MBF6462839.1 ABC transporter ATP-binding protein [Nocardia puris]RBO96780.1 ABC-2 type transport system ATP-binding protein [Nocardia puris]
MTTVVEIERLRKSYGATRALDGLDLSVRAGEVHGFLGPNGAGKTTTIRILLGLIRADGGTARLFGRDPWRDAVDLHARVGYVPGDVDLWPSLTGGEVIDILSRLQGEAAPATIADLVDRFELDPSKKCSSYSKGNRQKVALIAAFASDPELLILDEPTSGLDPLMENVFTECVREATRRGRTVLLSSHILSEVEKLCHTVTIVRAGTTVTSGSLSDLRRATRTHFRVEMDEPAAFDLRCAENIRRSAHEVRFDIEPARLNETLAYLAASDVRSVTSAPPSLEDLFLHHYEQAGELR